MSMLVTHSTATDGHPGGKMSQNPAVNAAKAPKEVGMNLNLVVNPFCVPAPQDRHVDTASAIAEPSYRISLLRFDPVDALDILICD
jgi:hypothetical protein